ncbi:uncharacterized protein A1O9_02307 [Exophiala aquamarina CBS 119918]|uniref:Potassium transport protein n=1 Tax=Exophiala aquamarina CBS 119918 TaxID=1182545 RepID=A0A072PLL4_9EURO|nr:uncharacterized protein A1O9_02307 [Exophiala aquamarina CBS 119918]KEF60746.1 hypothetical protein A1O9_02307 [Exophiala aquamarina CBS 119918]
MSPEHQDKDVETSSAPAEVVAKEKAPEADTTQDRNRTITFDKATRHPKDQSKSLYIPPPHARDKESEAIKPASRRRSVDGPSITKGTISMDRVTSIASSMFIVGHTPAKSRSHQTPRVSPPQTAGLPQLSAQVTIGRNSQFRNLTARDRERLGGIEYRSLKLLLKILVGYFFGLHLFGVICLVPWVQNAPQKYLDWLAECGQDKTWWAFYSAQTMVNNLGFTLTPDSMIHFQDATWPMLVMTFLAFAGETFYPIFLRLVIWIISKIVPKTSAMREQLQFLLDHPRRCYTLLFPSKPTWILFGILFLLNFIDVLLIIVLDLDNSAIDNLSTGPRILAALFQAASSRHTGTSTFNLADVNPAVQWSLVVMMYIAVFPIAISIRASNTYEEKSLGIYSAKLEMDESKGASYVLMHMQNQLSFDLWYIFLGVFCVCCAEADKIVDLSNPLVICAMMIRGRHRGLPYSLDRAIMLPAERDPGQEDSSSDAVQGKKQD